MSKINLLLKEPLIHFLAAALLLFVIYRFMQDDTLPQETSAVVRVTAQDIERMNVQFQERWKRVPTTEELMQLYDQFVREEILYREALAMGLSEGDTVIRRRLAQKLAFLSNDLVVEMEPGEAELRAWYEENSDYYTPGPSFTFTHLYFNSEKRGAAAESDAADALSDLQSSRGASRRSQSMGDVFAARKELVRTPLIEINRLFGTEFGIALLDMKVGEWGGPVASPMGFHLVRIQERSDPNVPTFESMRERVESDWLAERAQEVDRTFYEELAGGYSIEPDDEVKSILRPSDPGNAQ